VLLVAVIAVPSVAWLAGRQDNLVGVTGSPGNESAPKPPEQLPSPISSPTPVGTATPQVSLDRELCDAFATDVVQARILNFSSLDTSLLLLTEEGYDRTLRRRIRALDEAPISSDVEPVLWLCRRVGAYSARDLDRERYVLANASTSPCSKGAAGESGYVPTALIIQCLSEEWDTQRN